MIPEHQRTLDACPPGSRISITETQYEVLEPCIALRDILTDKRIMIRRLDVPVVMFEPGEMVVTVLELPK